MSFLSELQKKKNLLKTTSTVVTHPDGQKFLETKSEKLLISNNNYGFVVDTKPDKIPSKIIDYLYLGSQDCCDQKVLQDYNITRVLSVGIEAPVKYDGIEYKYVQCLDLPESCLDNTLKECLPFIQTVIGQSLNVLVHCNAGVSRSSSIVIGYLILGLDYNFANAFEIVRSARNCIKPNTGFLEQLQQLKK